MWCSRCRRDVPCSAGLCGACGASVADAKSPGLTTPELQTDSSFAAELRRVRRMISNVDRVLGDSRMPSAPGARLTSYPTTGVVSSAKFAPGKFDAPAVSNGDADSSDADDQPFVDPTKTLTFWEGCGYLCGLATMIGAITLGAAIMLGKCAPVWSIGLGLAVCFMIGVIMLFWQRIEAQQRDMMLLRRFVKHNLRVDEAGILAGMHAESQSRAQRANSA